VARRPAALRLNAFEVYEPPASAGKAAPAAGRRACSCHGKLLYSMAANLADSCRAMQLHPEDTIVVSDGAVDMTAASAQRSLRAASSHRIGDFVALFRIAAMSKRPELVFRFHRPGVRRLGTSCSSRPIFECCHRPAGARPRGAQTCCQEFDLYVAPLDSGGAIACSPGRRRWPCLPRSTSSRPLPCR